LGGGPPQRTTPPNATPFGLIEDVPSVAVGWGGVGGGGGSAEDGSGEHNVVVGSSKSHVQQHSVLPGAAVST
jgi:hypothetical protein